MLVITHPMGVVPAPQVEGAPKWEELPEEIRSAAVANAISIGYTVVAEGIIGDIPKYDRAISGGTAVTSAIAAYYSFLLATTAKLPEEIPNGYKTIAGIFGFFNAILVIRSVIDVFRKKPHRVTPVVIARETLKV